MENPPNVVGWYYRAWQRQVSSHLTNHRPIDHFFTNRLTLEEIGDQIFFSYMILGPEKKLGSRKCFLGGLANGISKKLLQVPKSYPWNLYKVFHQRICPKKIPQNRLRYLDHPCTARTPSPWLWWWAFGWWRNCRHRSAWWTWDRTAVPCHL